MEHDPGVDFEPLSTYVLNFDPPLRLTASDELRVYYDGLIVQRVTLNGDELEFTVTQYLPGQDKATAVPVTHLTSLT